MLVRERVKQKFLSSSDRSEMTNRLETVFRVEEHKPAARSFEISFHRVRKGTMGWLRQTDDSRT